MDQCHHCHNRPLQRPSPIGTPCARDRGALTSTVLLLNPPVAGSPLRKRGRLPSGLLQRPLLEPLKPPFQNSDKFRHDMCWMLQALAGCAFQQLAVASA
jgi:hypothetical protein